MCIMNQELSIKKIVSGPATNGFFPCIAHFNEILISLKALI